MKASRSSEAERAFIIKRGADGMPAADICREADIGRATDFNSKNMMAYWRARCGY